MKTLNVNITIDILKEGDKYFCRVFEEDLLIPLEKGMGIISTQEGLIREDFVFGKVFGKPIKGVLSRSPLKAQTKAETVFTINEHGEVEWED